MSVKRKVTAPVGNRSAGMTKNDTRADSTNIVLAENVTTDVPRRRLVALALVVTVLLAVVAVAARGRPLGTGQGSGSGLPGSFWDFAFTTLLIVEVLLGIVGIVGVFLYRRGGTERRPFHTRTARSLAFLLLAAFLITLFARHVDLNRLLHRHASPHTSTLHSPPGPGATGRPHTVSRHAHFRWEELVVVLGLLVALGVLARATRSRLGPGTRRDRRAPEVLAAALDASLDDLRTDPDFRRAIVAAYARMETALAAAGLPRHPAEAPLEYVERALLSLDASADAVRRLTDLFEWARFSQHEPEPAMRDEAVDALVAVRDELRAAELTLA